ncbi:MAG: hypothetical protein F6K09_02700 [Merismopedia sp. SIO2A8]|nr:hypothetical protein [Merismopedia sp. SIO2A8]
MVVLSSVVLVAKQWQFVSPLGQYSILFGYTLAFWGAASWTQRQSNLQLTSFMLRATTLLIIPINFWMIDGLGLWNSLLGWSIGILAALTLSVMTLMLLTFAREGEEIGEAGGARIQPPKSSASFIAAVNTIALSGLHWGWAMRAPDSSVNVSFPLIATYMGTIGTAIWVNRYVSLLESTSADTSHQGIENDQTSLSPISPSPTSPSPTSPIPIELIAVAFATLLLVVRAVVAANVPWSQLGLAIGLCGWVISWISRTSPTRDLWMKGGAKLLLLGWLVSVAVNPPWQAALVSGLGLWIVGDRLLRHWHRIDLIALFIVGLETLWVCQRVVPGGWRQYAIDLCTRLSGPQGMPTALISLSLFPYVLITLGMAGYLRRRQQEKLAKQSDYMALGLGTCLSVIGTLNPVTRSLNLLASTITLTLVLTRRSRWSTIQTALIYLIHSLVVGTILSWINTLAPTLPILNWAVILVGMAIAHWLLHLRLSAQLSAQLFAQPVRRSTWHVGLVLSAIAYPLFINAFFSSTSVSPIDSDSSPWFLVWFLVPTVMMYVGDRSDILPPKRVGWYCTVAILLAQVFLFSLKGVHLGGVGLTAILLLRSVSLTQSIWTAGLGIGAGVLWGWIAPYDIGLLQDENLLYWMAATPGMLWGLWTLGQSTTQSTTQSATQSATRSATQSATQAAAQAAAQSIAQNESPIVPVFPITQYRRALNGWAIAISAVMFLGLTVNITASYPLPPGYSQGLKDAAIATALITAAILYRVLRQLTQLGLWGLAWGVGLFVAAVIPQVGGDVISLSVALLALGLVSQLAGDWSTRHTQHPYVLSWHLIPLSYGLLGWLFSQSVWTATTGLHTIAFALIGIGIGRRSSWFKPLTTLAIGGVSFAIYQLVIYQMQQASGGQIGDGLMILSSLGIGLAIAYALAPKVLQHYVQLTQWEIQGVAHVHWGLANGLLWLGLTTIPRSPMGYGIGTLVLVGLAAYALGFGRTALHNGCQSSVSESSVAQNSFSSSELSGQPVQPQRSTAITSALRRISRNDCWTLLGILEGLGAIAHGLYHFSPNQMLLLQWAGAIAVILAVGCYGLPWDRWGWSLNPWRWVAIILPGSVLLLTATLTVIPCVLINGAFYAWLAYRTGRIRISYISVVCISWALLWFFNIQQWTQMLWISLDVGGAILYIVQVDPELRSPSSKNTRHILRTLAASLVCFTSIYQSQDTPWVGVLTIVFSAGLILVGIGLRTRAYLYVGTGTLLFESLRYTQKFIGQHPFQIWAVAFVLGSLLIWIAATFEARRQQVRTLLNYWRTELASWE